MYKRLVGPAPENAIENGKILFGTYNTPFENVNLVDAPKPFTRDLSPVEKLTKIQHWEAFQMGDERFFVMAVISPPASFSEVMIYDNEKKKQYKKRILDGPGVATRTAMNVLDSKLEHKASDGSYYAITNTLGTNGKIVFEMKSDEFNFYYEGDFSGREPIVVMLPFSENRPFYSQKCLAPGKGYIEMDGERMDFSDKAFMFMDDHVSFYPHRYWYDWVTCAQYQNGKLVGVQLTTNQVLDPLYNNENCLWVDGKMHPLPNIHFYRCRDRGKRWFIKDDLGMVDLTFDPTDYDVGLQMSFETDNKFLDFYAPFGYLSGTVTASDGTNVTFDNIYCMGEDKNGQDLPDEMNIDN